MMSGIHRNWRIRAVVVISVVLLVAAGAIVYLHFFSLTSKERAVLHTNARQLRNLGVILCKHAEKHDSTFPRDLGVLYDDKFLVLQEEYIVPGSPTMCPCCGDDIRRGHCDYIYLAAGCSLPLAEDTPLLVTKPGILPKGRVNVLLGNLQVVQLHQLPDETRHCIDDLIAAETQSEPD